LVVQRAIETKLLSHSLTLLHLALVAILAGRWASRRGAHDGKREEQDRDQQHQAIGHGREQS
jgi:hypothetical protein